MTRILSSLAEIQDQYDALFCDLWGCVHNGVTAWPAAVAALQAFRAKGGRVIYLTNSPRPKPSVERQLDHLQVPKDTWDDLVTSGDAAQFALFSGAVGHRVLHIGPQKDRTFFTERGADMPDTAIELVSFEEAEGIVCTDLNDSVNENPEEYRGQLMLAKERGLKLLCANPDISVDVGERRQWCAGALAKFYEDLGGEALYFGKPHPPIYDLARRRLQALAGDVPEARILCIGDGILTDVAGGAGESLDTIFLTGGLAAAEFGPDVENPDAAMLERWLAGHQMAPAYSMGRLR